MLKRLLKRLGILVAVLVLAGAVLVVNTVWFRPWSLNVFYEKAFVEVVFDAPELLTSLGLVERFGIRAHSGKRDDLSTEQRQKAFDLLRKNLETLRSYPLEKQSASQRLSTEIFAWYLERSVEGEAWQWHDYPVNQLAGVQNQFPSFMANTHRLNDKADCDYYLERLHAAPRKFDDLQKGLLLREQRGITPPRFVVERVLTEMNAFVSQPAAENILARCVAHPRDRTERNGRVRPRRIGHVAPSSFDQQHHAALARGDGRMPRGGAYIRLIDRFARTERGSGRRPAPHEQP
jgi:uncharacterized protein (DUF885 family)